MSVVFGGGGFGPPPRRFYQAFERPRLDAVGFPVHISMEVLVNQCSESYDRDLYTDM